MTILFGVALLTLFISANCSLYEAILYSSRTGGLEAAKDKPGLRARALAMLDMKKNISSPIAAILILNTIANTAGATAAGMYADRVLPPWGVIVFSVVFTISILLLAEILPKTAGAVHWRALWPFVVFPIRVISSALKPFVFAVQKFTAVFDSKTRAATITEDEILALVNLGAREGELSREESRMVNNIIKLEDSTVTDIMTPRTVVFSLDMNQTPAKAYKTALDQGFSRIPVYEGDRESVKGYVLRQDLETGRSLRKRTLKTLLRDLPRVPENESSLSMLLYFMKKRTQLALVEDQFGGIAGLISMEDIIEAILGVEIVDETDKLVDTREVAKKRKHSSQ